MTSFENFVFTSHLRKLKICNIWSLWFTCSVCVSVLGCSENRMRDHALLSQASQRPPVFSRPSVSVRRPDADAERPSLALSPLFDYAGCEFYGPPNPPRRFC